MKKPELPLKHGAKYICEPKYEEKHLKSKVYVHPDYMDRYEENWEDQKEEDDEVMPAIEEWWYDTDVFTLQELLDSSKDMDPKDVIISVHRDRHINDITISVTHRSTPDLDAWKAGKEAEEADYQARLAIYKKEIVKFRKWEAEEKIKQLKEKLTSLEKGVLDEREDF